MEFEKCADIEGFPKLGDKYLTQRKACSRNSIGVNSYQMPNTEFKKKVA